MRRVQFLTFTVFFLVSCVFAWPSQRRAGTSGPETPLLQGQAAGTIGLRCRPPARGEVHRTGQDECLIDRSRHTPAMPFVRSCGRKTA
jgi:hypothetical protein